KMVEARILGEESVEHGAKQKDSGALECLLVDGHRDLDAARCPDAAAFANTAHHWPAVDVANAADATLGGGVGHFRKHRQGFPQRLSVVPGTALHKTEMVGAEHIDQAPGDSTRMGHLAATAELCHDRLVRRRRPSYAHQVQGGVVDKPKIGAAY